MPLLAYRMKDQNSVASLWECAALSWSTWVLPGLSWATVGLRQPVLSRDLLGSHTGTRSSRSVAALLQLGSWCEEVEEAGAMMCHRAG